jgi:predicted nucleic acid-binding Zn ribbon protein
MARKNRKLAQTALVLAATTLVQAVVQKLADDPKFRRMVQAKAKAVAGSAGKALKRSGKKLTRKVKGRGKTKSVKQRASRRRGKT